MGQDGKMQPTTPRAAVFLLRVNDLAPPAVECNPLGRARSAVFAYRREGLLRPGQQGRTVRDIPTAQLLSSSYIYS